MKLLKSTQENTLMSNSNFFSKKDKTIIFTPTKGGMALNT